MKEADSGIAPVIDQDNTPASGLHSPAAGVLQQHSVGGIAGLSGLAVTPGVQHATPLTHPPAPPPACPGQAAGAAQHSIGGIAGPAGPSAPFRPPVHRPPTTAQAPVAAHADNSTAGLQAQLLIPTNEATAMAEHQVRLRKRLR